MSPVGGGQPDPFLIHRDEDVASAPDVPHPSHRSPDEPHGRDHSDQGAVPDTDE
jgi:hypothetical protein